MVRAVIGDVSGHGADEAALGVCLRVARRTLVLAGAPEEAVLQGVEQILIAERPSDETFATSAMVAVDPASGRLGVWLAGHPAPLHGFPGGPIRQLLVDDAGPALGLLPGCSWTVHEHRLLPGERLLLFTDGIVEGRTPNGDRLGDDGLARLLASRTWPAEAEDALDELIDAVEGLNGEPLPDDVALLRLTLAQPTGEQPTGEQPTGKQRGA